MVFMGSFSSDPPIAIPAAPPLSSPGTRCTAPPITFDLSPTPADYKTTGQTGRWLSLIKARELFLLPSATSERADLGPKCVRLVAKGTNLVLFQIRSQHILAWYKSGNFLDNMISVHFWNLIWNSSKFVTFGANLTHFGANTDIPCRHRYRCAYKSSSSINYVDRKTCTNIVMIKFISTLFRFLQNINWACRQFAFVGGSYSRLE